MHVKCNFSDKTLKDKVYIILTRVHRSLIGTVNIKIILNMLVKKTAQDCQISFGIILKGMYQT